MAVPTIPNPTPYEYCDLVMKGGITSGVVYPLAITELANHYLFKNIGGNSAGAIAAVITAAAEYGKRSGKQNAYDVVASLPKQLEGNGFLLGLFRPADSTRKIFRIFLDVLKFQSMPARVLAAIWGVIVGFWYWGVLGFAIGAWPAYALHKDCPLKPLIILGSLWAVVFAAIAMLIAAVFRTLKSICANRFGLCSGFDDSQKHTLLTSWLNEQIQAAAGRTLPIQPPLTFGDLWTSASLPNETLKTGRMINLQVVTTNLTQGKPFTIPLQTRELFFDPNEFGHFFPPSIVKWLVTHAPQSKYTVQSQTGAPLFHLPDPEYFPILLAARMSLSFPILLSAIPLYQIDFSRKANENLAPGQVVNAEKCWFSDGGLCSNFPIQFFDSPLPRWPTFGIDLKAPHPDYPNEKDFVWLPTTPGSGVQVGWNKFDEGSSGKQILGFFGAIINTMMNWRDNLQATSSGYRDRIVHISLKSDEGGLNLNMPSKLIGLLSDRGKRAGILLKTQFDLGSHIWGRYRITMCGIQNYLTDLKNSWTNPLPQDQTGWDYIKQNAPPPHYKSSPALLAALLRALQDLVQLPDTWSKNPPNANFCDDAPQPEPVLRGQPKF